MFVATLTGKHIQLVECDDGCDGMAEFLIQDIRYFFHSLLVQLIIDKCDGDMEASILHFAKDGFQLPVPLAPAVQGDEKLEVGFHGSVYCHD